MEAYRVTQADGSSDPKPGSIPIFEIDIPHSEEKGRLNEHCFVVFFLTVVNVLPSGYQDTYVRAGKKGPTLAAW